ncbi:ROK family protein [Cytophagaceae bacterium DM2B3-1]|uniref:ROK family protein n=1 Tax=Xanthocytophaga flava TaxID=3048013 RepID=A0ABT7CCU8_9BACT|nr:ROK family protein [Xanthocytophaga flavus]MDJ1491438.1 ROK family protein [Xanthocytophaga flavus]
MPLWGIDLGGTKIEGVILESANDTKVISRLRIDTEADQGYEHILDRIVLLVQKLSAESGLTPTTLGIGTPGTLDPITQTLKNSNTTCMNGKPFKKDLEAKLGFPIALANDANCFALAEARLGAAKRVMPDAEVVFGVIMGTGVGGGLVVHGKVINGRQGNGGEWGHIFLDESGGPCYCGQTGCVETVIAGPSLQRYYESISGKKATLKEIVKSYEAGNDPYAQATIKRLLEMFGKGISVIINIIDPDIIVMGGGVSNIDLLYTEGIAEASKHIFNTKLDTIFLKAELGDSAGVFGAAMLVG